MRRIRLIVSYDGTGYFGSQIQPNAVTVEQKLNKLYLRVARTQASTRSGMSLSLIQNFPCGPSALRPH